MSAVNRLTWEEGTWGVRGGGLMQSQPLQILTNNICIILISSAAWRGVALTKPDPLCVCLQSAMCYFQLAYEPGRWTPISCLSSRGGVVTHVIGRQLCVTMHTYMCCLCMCEIPRLCLHKNNTSERFTRIWNYVSYHILLFSNLTHLHVFFSLKRCGWFNLFVIRLHDFVHTLPPEHTKQLLRFFFFFAEFCMCHGAPGQKWHIRFRWL